MPQPLTKKQQYWSEILESADRSDLSLAEFARQNQIVANDLYRWRSQLKKAAQPTDRPSTPPTSFTQVVASYPAAVSLSIHLPQAQLQFATLPPPEWLAQWLRHQGVSA